MSYILESIQNRTNQYVEYFSEFEWVINKLPPQSAQRIINFGCNIGRETVALACFSGATQVDGIDRSEQVIRQAQDELKYFKIDLKQTDIQFNHASSEIKQSFKSWVAELPSCVSPFLHRLKTATPTINYYTADFTQQTELTQNYYDLAYCRFVLNHIWTGNGDQIMGDIVMGLSALSEMSRVVRPGGYIAFEEPNGYEDKRFDYDAVCNELGLIKCYEFSRPYNGWNRESEGVLFLQRLYQKPE
jgi:SAM-dependent methyltransferase